MIKDILGREVQVGDTVLTKGYGSIEIDTVTEVLKVTNNYVFVELPLVDRIMKRDTYQILVIGAQLNDNKIFREKHNG